MLGIRKVNISDNERGLLFRRDNFRAVLTPGTHWLIGRTRVEVHDISTAELDHRLGRFLMRAHGGKLAPHVDAVDLKAGEVGLVYQEGKLVDILAPGEFQLYWTGIVQTEVEILDIHEHFEVARDVLAQVADFRDRNERLALAGSTAVTCADVPDNHVGLLRVNGKLERELEPGSYGFWNFERKVAVQLLDCRLQNLEVSGQEILTKDRVSLRINLSASYRIRETHKVATLLGNYREYLYRLFQLALRESVGTRTLDELLADKDALNGAVSGACVSRASDYGFEIVDVGVKDIILPGEMKDILNQVVAAQKTAEANLIKRREETQATRSLHNTAKVMEGNPVLMRLKELEVLEKVTERIGHLTVFGGLEGVLTDLVRIPDVGKDG